MTTLNFPKPGTPFRALRIHGMKVGAAMALPEPARTIALRAIPPYKGRGKNFDYPFVKRCDSLASNPKPSKYKPHVGRWEKLKRVLGLS